MITIVDYGLGNLGSVQNMLTKLGESSVITSDANVISNASKLILPGVGSFDTGINKIRELGLESVLNQMALNKKIPILGICLGAQLMTNSSEEGVEKGLGWFDAETKKFNHSGIIGKWPLPNIGWRDIKNNKDYPLLDGIKRLPRFYFVHSYVLTPNNDSIISMRSEYGYDFACGLHRDNLHCVQFHPEKSHSFGFKFMNNFINI
jgi:imidazole glycerol-phosphate synthase subunit HisH